jgi:hypothetical protein
MNYMKPEVASLGDARLLIESLTDKKRVHGEPITNDFTQPAYDLDE